MSPASSSLRRSLFCQIALGACIAEQPASVARGTARTPDGRRCACADVSPFVVVVLPAVVVTGVLVETAVPENATMTQRKAENMTVTCGAVVPAFCAAAHVTGGFSAAFCAEYARQR